MANKYNIRVHITCFYEKENDKMENTIRGEVTSDWDSAEAELSRIKRIVQRRMLEENSIDEQEKTPF